tara:strand:- start:6212 stop:7129 length:918 start_codon:yes stop_codon:yes gene_type:complete
MSRKIPTALLAHLQQSVTTTCRLLRITLNDGRQFGMTTLDRDVEYLGVNYSAVNGFDPSIIATDTGLSVDNAEAYALLSADVPGITVEMVAAGELDDAQWQMTLINWADLSMGHMIVDAGDVGEVNTEDGVVWMPELLSYAMRLRQPIGHFWSRNCRATFGSDQDTQTGCGVDAVALFQSGAVTSVGDEPFRVFADSSLVIDPVPNTARVQWLTGPNAGQRLYQVEGYGPLTGTVALVEPTPFEIVAGHTFRIRPDCDKTPATCSSYGNFLNYKGESLIPVGEGTAILSPQASIPGGFQGSEVIE